MAMKLVSEKTGKDATKNMQVRTFRGEIGTLVSWEEPKHVNSTGRIYVKMKGASCDSSFFPGVCNLKFVEA